VASLSEVINGFKPCTTGARAAAALEKYQVDLWLVKPRIRWTGAVDTLVADLTAIVERFETLGGTRICQGKVPPDDNWNALVSILGRIHGTLTEGESNMTVQNAAIGEAVDVAADEAGSFANAAGDTLTDVGQLVKLLTRYFPYIIGIIAVVLLYPHIRKVFS
jgi:hypothetical protein